MENLFRQIISEAFSITTTGCNDFSWELLKGDASQRKYYRVEFDKKRFIFCMDPHLKIQTSNELPQNQIFQILLENDINVPKIYYISDEFNCVIQEDLGNVHLIQYVAKKYEKNKELLNYSQLLNMLQKFNKLSPTYYNLKINTPFNVEKFLDEFNLSMRWFVQEFKNCKYPAWVEEQLLLIIDELCSMPQVFLHRDFHSKNIMVTNCDGEDQFSMIDYQDARLGPYLYDYVSILDDFYFEIHPENKQKLLDKIWKDNYLQVSESQFFYDYNLCLIQRSIKALGTFSFQYKVHNKLDYLPHIGFTLEKCKMALLKNPKYQKFTQWFLEVAYA